MIMASGKLKQYSDDNKLYSVFLEKYGMVSFAVRRGNSMLLSVLNEKSNPPAMLGRIE